MSNRAIALDPGREISTFEATVGSIKRRLTNPLPRRQNRLERRALQVKLRHDQTQSNTMPKRNGKKGDYNEDWEASGDEMSYVNGVGGNDAGSHDASRGGERDSNNYTTNSKSGKSHQKRDGGTSQEKKKQGLGQWTGVVNDSIQKMGAAHGVLKELQDAFASHKDELDEIERTRATVIHLQEECEEKQKEIQRQADTITTLSKMSRDTEEKVAKQKDENEQGKKDLEKERVKLDKRVTVMIAEERANLKAELDKLLKAQNQSYDAKKKGLQDELTEKTDQAKKQVEALESENKQLLTTVERQRETIGLKTTELENSIEQCDILKRAKDSFKNEMQDREKQLDMMKREFALNPVSKDDFKRRFAEIYDMIEKISFQFSHGIDEKSHVDLELTSKALAAADCCFESVPIDNSDDSLNLRSAHAQRIISDSIYEYIWKPFRSEFTLSHQEFSSILTTISEELERNSHGGRAPNVWTALTMKALQSLPTESVTSHNSASSTVQIPQGSSRRVEAVISKIFHTLSHMINPSQRERFQIELTELANRAIDIWDDAQSGELKITVIPSLDRTNHEEWHSQKFEPLQNFEGSIPDTPSKTHPRIFTLFPRIMAREVVDSFQDDAAPPGSWPAEPTQASPIIETCIYPGRGLPEWSQLVVRGKTAQEDKKAYLKQAMESATEAVHIQRRNTVQGRRESVGPLTSPSSSPSQQWKTGGFMKITDN